MASHDDRRSSGFLRGFALGVLFALICAVILAWLTVEVVLPRVMAP